LKELVKEDYSGDELLIAYQKKKMNQAVHPMVDNTRDCLILLKEY